MGKVYKDKKGSSCKMCKPHKNGWAKKNTNKNQAINKSHDKEIKQES